MHDTLCQTLRAEGHEVRALGAGHTAFELAAQIQHDSSELVFNVCESFGGSDQQEQNVAALLELFGKRFTGAGSIGLALAHHAPQRFLDDLPAELIAELQRLAVSADKALKLRDYGRIDMRLRKRRAERLTLSGKPRALASPSVSDDWEVFLIEVNPNPHLACDSELPLAARGHGLAYPALIEHIVECALARPLRRATSAVQNTLLGPRVGLSIPLHRWLELDGHVEGSYALTNTTLGIADDDLWSTSTLAGLLGIGLVGRVP